jgi:hypothetical protein
VTSPGGWFGSYIDDVAGSSKASAGGSKAPSGSKSPVVTTVKASDYGNKMYDALDLPPGGGDDLFSMKYSKSPYGPVSGPYLDEMDRPGANIEMSVAAGLEWLRDQAVNNTEGYNSLVVQLWQAGYLSQGDIKLGSWSSAVAQAFADAAWDVSGVNAKQDGGALMTLYDHLDAIIAENQKAGFGVDTGSGGAAPPTPPSRIDQLTADEDLKASINSTAHALLGRKLTDDEESRVTSLYRGAESKWNAQRYTAQLAQFNDQPGTLKDKPTTAAATLDVMKSNPALAQERAGEDLASYIGIMGQMMGLSTGGMNGLASG